METKTLRERKTKTLKEETKNERETTSERNTLSHTHWTIEKRRLKHREIQTKRRGDQKIEREGEID